MKRGFTLIELMVVIAIIGILAALLVPTIATIRQKARIQETQNKIKDGQEFYVKHLGQTWQVTEVKKDGDLVLVNDERNIVIDYSDDHSTWNELFRDVVTKKVSKPLDFVAQDTQENKAPQATKLKLKVGDRVDHKLMFNWAGGIITKIENGTYTVKFKIEDKLKEVKDLTDAELEKAFGH